MFLGLRSVIYPAHDLAASKESFTRLLGIEPYFDEPFYVGFEVGGYELGLDPNADVAAGPITYWGVENVDAAVAGLISAGASARGEVQDVGDGVRMATVVAASGDVVGVIENPSFSLPASEPTESTGGGGR